MLMVKQQDSFKWKIFHLFLQQLAVDKLKFAVGEAASRACVNVTGGQDGHHVIILPGLSNDVLEQSWKTGSRKDKRHPMTS